MKDNERDSAPPDVVEQERARSDAVRAAPPTPDSGVQPGFKVVDEAPSRGGSKLVWTALLVVVAILAGYMMGYFR
jgi:hypothetical protein